MEQIIDLSQGGLVLVVLGKGFDVPSEYAIHAQVHAVAAGNIPVRDVLSAIPPNTKVAVLTDQIPKPVYVGLQIALRKRHILYLPRRTMESVEATLRTLLKKKNGAGTVMAEAFASVAPSATEPVNGTNGHGSPPPDAPAAPAAPSAGEKRARGAVAEFIRTHADLSGKTSAAEESRRLLALAQKRGLSTTFHSLEVGIRALKRKGGLGSRPESLMAPEVSTEITLTRALDHAIEALQAVRPRIEQMDGALLAVTKERDELKAKLEILREALKL